MYKSIIIGRLARTPILERASNGSDMMVLNIIAVNGYNDRNGVWKEKTSNIRVPIFGPRAVTYNTSQYFKQGHVIYVETETNVEEYIKNGVKHYATNHSPGTIKRISRTFAEMAATQAQYASANTLDTSNMQSFDDAMYEFTSTN